MAQWPGGTRGALCLSFDNLGEAAAIELGAVAADDPSVGEHPTVTRTLPALLELLSERELAATFFVEGLNAKLYPDALRATAAAGHEVAYHAWRHEQWGDLTAAEQAENLARGQAAFAELDLEIAGLRPPGGQLGAGGVEVPREMRLRYSSPAGAGVGIQDGVALLPFQWRHVDASCVLPGLGPVREQMTGSRDPMDPDHFLAYVDGEIEQLGREGEFMAVVLHLSLLDWLGPERLGALLGSLRRATDDNRLWVAPCRDVAAHLLAHADRFPRRPALDSTTWSEASG